MNVKECPRDHPSFAKNLWLRIISFSFCGLGALATERSCLETHCCDSFRFCQMIGASTSYPELGFVHNGPSTILRAGSLASHRGPLPLYCHPACCPGAQTKRTALVTATSETTSRRATWRWLRCWVPAAKGPPADRGRCVDGLQPKTRRKSVGARRHRPVLATGRGRGWVFIAAAAAFGGAPRPLAASCGLWPDARARGSGRRRRRAWKQDSRENSRRRRRREGRHRLRRRRRAGAGAAGQPATSAATSIRPKMPTANAPGGGGGVGCGGGGPPGRRHQ